jgi:hypothetical protein
LQSSRNSSGASLPAVPASSSADEVAPPHQRLACQLRRHRHPLQIPARRSRSLRPSNGNGHSR